MDDNDKRWLFFNSILVLIILVVSILYASKEIGRVTSSLSPLDMLLIILLALAFIILCLKWGAKVQKVNIASKTLNNKWAVLSAVLLLILMIISGYFATAGLNWIFVVFFLLLFFMVVGTLINGRLSGVLIDERNQMSLSRFQMVLWTLIIVSAFLTIALVRIHAGIQEALNITVPEQLWALLGISTTALVGTPLLLSIKKDKNPTPEEVEKLNIKAEKYEKNKIVDQFGLIPVKKSYNDAEFADMFRGDETSTLYSINMAKVQMFFFTVIAALSYAVLLYNSISNVTDGNVAKLGFPIVSAGFIAVLAISNAGYLTNKGIDQTATDQNGRNQPPSGPNPDDQIPPQDQNPPSN